MPALSIPTNLAQVEAWAGALYGSAVGQTTMNQINSDIVSYGGLNNTLNAYYSSAFGSLTTAAVAASVVTNLGIVAGQNGLVAADVNQANLYVVGVLNGTAANARGVAIANVVSLFNGLAGTTGALANFSAAATAWLGTVANSIAYNGSNATDNTFTVAAATVATQNASAAALAASAAAAAVAAKSATLSTPLTVGTDTIVASTNAISVSGTAGVSTTGAQPTFTAGDSITGLTGVTTNALNVTDQTTGATWTPTSLGGVSISGIQNVTFSSGEAVTADTTSKGGAQGYTGLTSLGVYGSGGLNVTTAGTVGLTATDNNSTVNNETVAGGNTVALTVNGITTGAGKIVVGTSTAAPQGNVTVSTTQIAVAGNSYTSDPITITGGQSVTVSETIPLGLSAVAAGVNTNYINTGGNVTITGQLPATASNATATNSNATGTNAVSVTQSKASASSVTVALAASTVFGAGAIIYLTDGSGNTLRLTSAGAQTLNANQLAQAIYAGLSGVTAGNALYSGLTPAWDTASAATFTATATAFGTAARITASAPSIGGNTITYNLSTTYGTNVAMPAYTTAAGGASTATVGGIAFTAANGTTAITSTGGIYDGVVAISDANAASASAASTIGSVTLSGLSNDTNGVGSVINSSALQKLSLINIANGAKVTISNNLVGTTNTTLALTLNNALLGTAGSLTDTNGEITTLNITTTGGGSTGYSTLSNLNWANLQSITVAGTGAVRLGTLTTQSKLATFTVTGSASVQADVSNNTAFLTTITDSSTGQQVITIDPRTQTFNGTGSGQDIVTIAFAATSPVTGGSGTNNMLIWNGVSSPSSLGTVTNFSTLGLGANFAGGIINMANIGAAFTTIDLLASSASSVSLTNVVPGTNLAVDVVINSGNGTLSYTTTGTSGSTNSMTLTLGVSAADPRATSGTGAASATKFGYTLLGSLTLADAAITPTATDGVGTLSVSSFGSNLGQTNTIATLSDIGLNKLNISGTAGLTITTFSNDLSSSLAINNSSTSLAYSSIGTLTDNNLISLSFAGNGYTGKNVAVATIPVPGTSAMTLNDSSPALTVSNTGLNAVLLDISGAPAGTGPGIGSLTLTGSAATNIGTLTLTGVTYENFINTTSGGTNTIALLSDSGAAGTGLATLSVGGTGNTTFTSVDLAAAQTIINTNSGVLTISGETGTIAPATMTLMNSGTGQFNFTDSSTRGSLTALTLTGNVKYTATASTAAGKAGLTALATLTGSTDNAAVYVDLGADATANTVTLGNGNDTVITKGAASSTITLGTGSNTVNFGYDSTSATPLTNLVQATSQTVSFGPHSGGADTVVISGGSNAAAATGTSLGTLTGATATSVVNIGTSAANSLVAGDTIQFNQATGYATAGSIATQIYAVPAGLALTGAGGAIANASAADTAFGVSTFTWGGDTYLISEVANNTVAATTSLVKLAGIHSVSATVNGYLTILS